MNIYEEQHVALITNKKPRQNNRGKNDQMTVITLPRPSIDIQLSYSFCSLSSLSTPLSVNTNYCMYRSPEHVKQNHSVF